MPPKRKARAPPAPAVPKVRASKLARENNITASEELEIKECFQLFAREDESGEEELGVIRVEDVRRGMIALNIPPTPTELTEFLSILDPDDTGYTNYTSFLSICALKFRARDDDGDEDSTNVEVEEAFKLMTGGSQGPITIHHLRHVARLLNEDVTEEMFRDMILEGNGGKGISSGVGVEEFEGIMRRVGVLK